MIFGWDVVVHSNHLVYRSAFRNQVIPRDAIEKVSVEEGKSSNGLNNLMVLNVYRHESTKTTLKLFNCFKPTPERPSPFGFQRMKDVARELSDWLGTSREQQASA
jgi:hypothetical protein